MTWIRVVEKGTWHESKISFLSLLAGDVCDFSEWAVANALTVTETESFNFSTAQVTFNVTTDGNGNVSTTPDPLSQAVTTDFRDLTFNRFNTALGTLTAVTITLTSDYDVTVTVSATTTSPDEVTFFAETTSPFGHTLTGSGLISALTSTLPSQPFSASCVVNAPPDDDDMCNSGSQISNNNVFNGTASLAAMLASFSGSGTYNLTATLSSALAPRVHPDNETN